MRKLQTHISFADYQRMFKDKEVVGATKSEFYKLLEPAVIEIENDTLEVIMFFLDAWISGQIFSGKKFVGSQVMVIQEYVRRVLKTEEAHKLEEEIYNKEQREAKRRLQELRIEQMNKLSKDPSFTGIAPIGIMDKYQNQLSQLYAKQIYEEFNKAFKKINEERNKNG